jgi:hypothetical protein
VPARKAIRAVPNGGYVLSEGRGRLRLSANGRTIVDFTVVTRCAGPLALPPLRIATTGEFTFSGHPSRPATGTTVRVKGAFVSPDEARGTLRVIGTTCREPATPFVAQLS